MNLTPEDLEAERVLKGINGDPFDEVVNPLGLDRGGSERGVYVLGLRAIARWIRVGVNAAAEVLAVRDAIKAGPVASVVGHTGIVTAADIKQAIGYDALESDIETNVNQLTQALNARVDALDPRATTVALMVAYSGVR